MIDFIRIHYKDKIDIEPHVCNKDNFEKLHTSMEYHTAEISYPFKTKIENIEVVVNEKSVYVKNSLHKLHNILNDQGNQNHDDFHYSELCGVIDYLCSKLINLNTADITQLEFGLNIQTSKPAEVLIRENILMHNFKGYNRNERFSGKGEYKQFDYTNYFIKIYDKAKQYGRSKNILRFEIKFIKKREFNPLGIKNILDLKCKTNLNNLFNYLIRRFDELIIIDDFRSNENIPKIDKQNLENYSSSNFWYQISKRRFRNKKGLHKKIFSQLLEKYKLTELKSFLRLQLEEKFQLLLNN